MNVELSLQRVEDFPLENFDPSLVDFDLSDELTPAQVKVILDRVLMKGFTHDRLPTS